MINEVTLLNSECSNTRYWIVEDTRQVTSTKMHLSY